MGNCSEASSMVSRTEVTHHAGVGRKRERKYMQREKRRKRRKERELSFLKVETIFCKSRSCLLITSSQVLVLLFYSCMRHTCYVLQTVLDTGHSRAENRLLQAGLAVLLPLPFSSTPTLFLVFWLAVPRGCFWYFTWLLKSCWLDNYPWWVSILPDLPFTVGTSSALLSHTCMCI